METLTSLFQNLSNGLILGLANNFCCVLTCAPVILPYLLSDQRKPVFPIIKFLIGRLIAYIFFAFTAGYLGIYFEGRIDPKIFSIFIIVMSIWLITYTFGRLAKSFSHIATCSIISKHFKGDNFPLLAGIVMGLNICPPFLIGLSRTLEMNSIILPMFFFTGFFLGSSAWLMAFLFTGKLTEHKAIRTISKIAAIFVGIWYLTKGITILLEK